MTDTEHARYHASVTTLRYAVAVAAQVVGADAGARDWIARNAPLFAQMVLTEPQPEEG